MSAAPSPSASPASPVVRLSSVSKRFGDHPVLDQLDWQILPGQVVGLLGRNGAGKSTLLECLLGLREVDRGGVALFGEDAGRLSGATGRGSATCRKRPNCSGG